MSGRPRILWVSYTGTWVGPTNSLSLLLEHLRERFDSTVLVTGEGAFTQVLRQQGVPYDVIPIMGTKTLPRVVRYIRRGQFDLVYGNCTSGVTETAVLASRLTRRPVLCHVRAIWTDASWWRRRVFRLATGEIAVSRAAADAFARQVPGAKPTVVYNGIPVTPPVARGPARTALLEELGLEQDALLVLSLGHLVERKGQLDAVETLAEVVKQAPEAVLLAVGRLDREPEYVRAVESRIRQLDLTDHVRLLGFRRDVDRLAAASDVQVHTARIDPHPRAVLEGMAGSLPTVAYAVDGVGETVIDEETGLLVPPGDVSGLATAIKRLARDAEARARMGRAARQRVVRDFDARASARGVGDVIDRILARPAGPLGAVDGSDGEGPQTDIGSAVPGGQSLDPRKP